MEKPAASWLARSAGRAEPVLQAAALVTLALTAMRSVASMSSKPRLPLPLRLWAEASAASVKPKSAMSPITGASLVPVIVTVTVSFAVAPKVSVIVTV